MEVLSVIARDGLIVTAEKRPIASTREFEEYQGDRQRS
jgi:hypothetical protein